MMERLAIPFLAGILLGGGGLITGGCKAAFDPLPDDDTAGDDDSSAADDDTSGDDDTSEGLLFESATVDLEANGIYALFFIGSVDGSSPIQMLVLNNATVPGTVDVPHVRFIHGHATTGGAVDFYVTAEEIEMYSEAAIGLGSSAPDPMMFGYGDVPLGGAFEVDAYVTGTYAPDPTVHGPPLSAVLAENQYYSVVLTGMAAQPELVLVDDEQGLPAPGDLKIGVFHSIEGVPQINVQLEHVNDGTPQSIATALDIGTMGSTWGGLTAEPMIFRVYATTPLD